LIGNVIDTPLIAFNFIGLIITRPVGANLINFRRTLIVASADVAALGQRSRDRVAVIPVTDITVMVCTNLPGEKCFIDG